MYFWWVTRPLSPLFEFYEFFLLRHTLSFCGIATVHFLIHEKNHWVPIRAMSSLPYKRDHSSFNRQGDTLKLQRFFLKRKNCSGVRPSLFKKQFFCELFHFEFCKLRRLFTFVLCKGQKITLFLHRLFISKIFFLRDDLCQKSFSLLTAQRKFSQGQGTSWIRKMLQTDPDSVEKAH
jgi:hypothetical protein